MCDQKVRPQDNGNGRLHACHPQASTVNHHDLERPVARLYRYRWRRLFTIRIGGGGEAGILPFLAAGRRQEAPAELPQNLTIHRHRPTLSIPGLVPSTTPQ